MKIHCVCVVKDEVDVIEQTLKAASQWSDFIYVLDNGSCDHTWEKVLNLSQYCSQIIPYAKDDCAFHDGIRARVFHHYRANSQPGDWWCRLDADEIYIDDPRTFLAKVPKAYQAVWGASFQYYFTDKDVERYLVDPAQYADEVPIKQKCRYYHSDWSEARFFRDDRTLIWDLDRGWPYFGAVHPLRIRLKHYQYRSPQQMQKRIENRFKARAKGCKEFTHEATLQLSPTAWKDRVRPASELDYDAHDQQYILREDLMPQLPFSSPLILNRVRYLKKYARRLHTYLKR